MKKTYSIHFGLYDQIIFPYVKPSMILHWLPKN